MKIDFKINGTPVEVETFPLKRLLDVLREDLLLSSFKSECTAGFCDGTCVVLIDQLLVNSCLIPAAQCGGADILTAEGLGSADNPHPIQQIFAEILGPLCEICSPGLQLSTFDLLRRTPAPEQYDILESMSVLFHHCPTKSEQVVNAVKKAAEVLK